MENDVSEKLFTVAQAAEQIAAEHEPRAPVANQLRRLAQRGLVVAQGSSGTGRTAANLFGPCDLAAARIHRTLIALGIASDQIQEEARFACYDDVGALEAAVIDCRDAAINRFRPGDWVFGLYLCDPDETGQRTVNAKVFNARSDDRASHPALAAVVEIPMTRWLFPMCQRLWSDK